LNAQKIRQAAFNFYAFACLGSMAIMSIGGGIFVMGALLPAFGARKSEERAILRESFVNTYGLASLLFFLACFLSLGLAWIFPPLGMERSGFLELKKFHHFLYPCLIAAAFLGSRAIEKNRFWFYWGATGILMAVISALQYFAGDLFPDAWLHNILFRPMNSTGRYHGQGIMMFHLSFASCMCFMAASGIARVLWPLADDSARTRRFWAIVGVAGSAAVLFSFSRSGFFALAALICCLGFLRRPLWGLYSVIFCGAVAAGLWFEVPSVRQRFIEASSYNSERYIMWQTAWEMFKDRWLLGVGFGRSGDFSPRYAEIMLGHPASFTSHAHNNYLDILAATGLVGALGFIAWWGVLFLFAGRTFRLCAPDRRWLPAAALAGFVSFHVNGLTQVNFSDGKSQHTLMLWAGVVLALELRRRRENRAEQRN